MDESHVGSILLGFGTVSQVLIEQGLASAVDFSLWTQGLSWAMILFGLSMLGMDFRERWKNWQ